MDLAIHARGAGGSGGARVDFTMTMSGTVDGMEMTGQGQMREASYSESFPVR